MDQPIYHILSWEEANFMQDIILTASIRWTFILGILFIVNAFGI